MPEQVTLFVAAHHLATASIICSIASIILWITKDVTSIWPWIAILLALVFVAASVAINWPVGGVETWV